MLLQRLVKRTEKLMGQRIKGATHLNGNGDDCRIATNEWPKEAYEDLIRCSLKTSLQGANLKCLEIEKPN